MSEIASRRVEADWLPDVDAYDVENSIRIQLDLPGVNKEDVALNFRDGNLEVSGERKMKDEFKSGVGVLRERSYGKFKRVLFLPAGCDIDSISASMSDDGVLSSMFPFSA